VDLNPPLLSGVIANNIVQLQAVLQIRLYALYFHSKPVAIFLGIFFLGEIAACFEALIISALQTRGMCEVTHFFVSSELLTFVLSSFHLATAHPIVDVTSCTSLPVPPTYYFQFWLPIITYEALLGAFAVWIGVLHAREMKRWDVTGLTNILIRDNVLYFLV
jgi:hypothetical protein